MTVQRIATQCLPAFMQESDLLLVPNQRMRSALLDHYSSPGKQQVWRTPNIQAVDIWLREYWKLHAGAGLPPFCRFREIGLNEELLIWETIINESLSEFPLINPEDAAQHVNHSYQLLRQWQMSPPDEALAAYHYSNVKIFVDWCLQFRERCKNQGVLPLADLIHELVLMPKRLLQGLPKQIMLVNFSQPPPLYLALFDKLAASCEVEKFKTQEEPFAPGSLQRFEFTNARQEVEACADWAEQCLCSSGENHIAVLTPQNQDYRILLQRALMQRLSETDLTEINSSVAEQPLSEYGLINDGFTLLELNLPEILTEDFCCLLHSPYLLATEQETEARIKFERYLRDNKSVWSNPAELGHELLHEERDYYCPQLGQVLLENRTHARNAGKKAPASVWVSLFRMQLTRLQWPGSEINPTESAAHQLFQNQLDTLNGYTSLLGEISAARALAFLRTLCSNTKIANSGNPRGRLSVFTLEEAAGLMFDDVWVCGVDDQHWPAAADPSPFIPQQLQREWGIPSSHGELQHRYAKDIFSQILDGVRGSITCSHHCFEEDQELLPSPLILALPFQTHEQPHEGIEAVELNSHPLEIVNDSSSVPLRTSESPGGGQGIISDQSSCPFRAFARHRLGALPLREFSRGVDAKDRGIVLHLALEHFYSDVESRKGLAEMEEPVLDRVMVNSAEQALKYLQRRKPDIMAPRFLELEKERLLRLLGEFISLELERGDFQVLDREKEITWQRGQLTLSLKIDRVDKLADGSLALLDYKSGKTAIRTKDWLSERPENMQLPLYLTAQWEQQMPVSAVLIAHVNAEKIAYSGIAAVDLIHPRVKSLENTALTEMSWEELGRHWQQQVESIADEFIAGLAQIDPVNPVVTCRHCDLQALCRIAENENASPLFDVGAEEESVADV